MQRGSWGGAGEHAAGPPLLSEPSSIDLQLSVEALRVHKVQLCAILAFHQVGMVYGWGPTQAPHVVWRGS